MFKKIKIPKKKIKSVFITLMLAMMLGMLLIVGKRL